MQDNRKIFYVLNKQTMTTNKTLDDVILNDGDIATQTTQSQMQSNITIDVQQEMRKRAPRKPDARPPRSRKPAPELSRRPTAPKTAQPQFSIKPGEKPVRI
jgi:hypothetical protein